MSENKEADTVAKTERNIYFNGNASHRVYGGHKKAVRGPLTQKDERVNEILFYNRTIPCTVRCNINIFAVRV